MENRSPMKLDRIMQIYDVMQVVINGYLFYKVNIVILLFFASTVSFKL